MLYDSGSEGVPLVICGFEGKRLELVEGQVSHDLLVQRTVLGLGVETVVLPALLISAGDCLTRLDVLPEIQAFSWGEVLTCCSSQVLKAYHLVAIVIQPSKNTKKKGIRGFETPGSHQLRKVVKGDKACFGLIHLKEGFLKRFKLVMQFVDNLLLQVLVTYNLSYLLLSILILSHSLLLVPLILWVLHAIMPKIECLCWLYHLPEPLREVGIVNLRGLLEVFHFDEELQ